VILPRGYRHAGFRALRLTLGLAGIVFLLLALQRSWKEGVDRVDIDWWRLAMATLLLAAASVALAYSWAAMLKDLAPASKLARGFLRAQPAKYVPGGWAQPVSQVAHTVDAGANSGRAAVAYPVQAVCLAVAGAMLASGLVFARQAPLLIRWAAALGPLTAVFLSRHWMRTITDWLGRAFRRDGWGSLVPSQASILECFAWSVGAIASMGVAFALLASESYSGLISPFVAATGFSLAWLAGFVAVPVPAGVGVREVVLLVALGGAAPASLAVGFSIMHRALQMVAELAMAAAARLKRSPLKPAADGGGFHQGG
jgi:hypothetical protein